VLSTGPRQNILHIKNFSIMYILCSLDSVDSFTHFKIMLFVSKRSISSHFICFRCKSFLKLFSKIFKTTLII
jgi:hypothetical protein